MKIGLFGGAFDPIHRGHLAVARAALRQEGLNLVVFIPAYQSPGKLRASASGLCRLEMVASAIHREKKLSLSDWELQRKKKSYTVTTVRFFSKKNPDAELFWILGADAYQKFETWKQPEQIRDKAALLIAPRPGLRIEIRDSRDKILKMRPVDISSTQVRLRSRGSKGQGLQNQIPKPVIKYIKQHQLYSD